MENLIEQPRPAPGPGAVDWVPPRTREDADQAVIGLSNDIGLILAQLAEEQAAWCLRTGRAPVDYGAWRRRALFAKVHKESQLRECKRIRALLAGAAAEASSLPQSGTVTELVGRCRHVIEVWINDGARSNDSRLNTALRALAECLDRLPPATGSGAGAEVGVRGVPDRPILLEAPGAT